jgi:hypothetical protein
MYAIFNFAAMKPDTVKINAFMKSLFEPFLSQYPKYSQFHEKQIVSKIQAASAAASSAGDSVSPGPGLQDRIENSKRLLPEIILNIKEGEEKVNLFNHGFGYLHFGKGLNVSVNNLSLFITQLPHVIYLFFNLHRMVFNDSSIGTKTFSVNSKNQLTIQKRIVIYWKTLWHLQKHAVPFGIG